MEIHNLFGKIALDETLKLNTSELKEQTTILEALNVLTQAISDKLITVNTSNIQGEVEVINFPINNSLTDEELRVLPVDVNVKSCVLPTDAATNSKLMELITTITNKDVQVNGLTDTELRADPIPVSLDSSPLPNNAAQESTLNSIQLLTEQIALLITTVNDKMIVSNTDNVSAVLMGIREASMMNTISRLSYDGLNNLRVSNSPTGTQAVSIAATLNMALLSMGLINSQGVTTTLSKIAFNQMLSRMTFA